MQIKKAFTVAGLGLALLSAAGCAGTGASYQPVVDGGTGANYQADLAQCQQLSTQRQIVDSNTGQTAAAGAALGAVGTALVSNHGKNVRNAGIVGALAGATAGALQNNQSRESIISNCMRGRGYRVVG